MHSIESGANLQEDPLVEQFNHPEEIEINGEVVEVMDIAPPELKTDTPTIVVPGFSATPEALKDAILRTAEAGRRVISADAPHGVKTERKDTGLPGAEARKIEVLLGLIEAKDLEKVNVIANSEASIYTAAAAALFPEKFKNIVLVEPAGLIGNDSFFKLLKRVQEDLKKERERESRMQRVKYPASEAIGRRSIRSNIIASIREVRAMAHADITPLLEQAHKQGVGISIIHAVEDRVFPMERVQQMVKSHMIDGFYSVEGTHNSIYQFEPFGRAAEKALSALERKSEKKEADR